MSKLRSYYFKASGPFLFDDGSARIEFTGTVFAYDRSDAEDIILRAGWSTPVSLSGNSWDVDIDSVELTEYDEDPEIIEDLDRGIVDWDTDENKYTMEAYEHGFGDEFDRDDYYGEKYGY